MDFTPLARKIFASRIKKQLINAVNLEETQRSLLRRMLRYASVTEKGKLDGFSCISSYEDFRDRVKTVKYEDIRENVMRMIKGEKNILWPGRCHSFAQSSGTSDGVSKYIPVTSDSLRLNHYRGAADAVAHYLWQVKDSRIFSGKGFILGGSFANTLDMKLPGGVEVGDLSATLISHTPFPASLFRIPDKKTALLADWEYKLRELVKKASNENVTNISGVPSWFMTVIRHILDSNGCSSIHEIWPNLEVFFHGGISFEPYREQYRAITDSSKMHFLETYNASEGFFAVQDDLTKEGMMILPDAGVFYELESLNNPGVLIPSWEAEIGNIYSLYITACNGLWRYEIGDTVEVTQVMPLKIKIAGRIHSFINVFGEELMETNADRAIAEVCRLMGASIKNYTAAPVYAEDNKRGRHEWIIEWEKTPDNTAMFAQLLDERLRSLNSDYDAKRRGNLFMDMLTVIDAPAGLFDRWLASSGTGKLGGQRKMPRLCNNRHIADALLKLASDIKK